MPELDFEAEVQCEICKSMFVVTGTCEISIDRTRPSTELLESSEDPKEPYQTLIPNISSINHFNIEGTCGDKEFYSDGHICFIGRPSYIFYAEDIYGKNDWAEEVTKWFSKTKTKFTPTLANSGRVLLVGNDGTKALAPRHCVDVFRTMYPDCLFQGSDSTGFVGVFHNGQAVGGFMPIRVTETVFESAPSPDDPGHP